MPEPLLESESWPRTGRYAIYLTPPPSSPLASLGADWLGRAVDGGETRPQPAIDGLSPEDQVGLTRSARHYGFHGTMKPPFALAEGASANDLADQFARFCGEREAPAPVPLRIASIGRFLALVPAASAPALDALAADCVRAFDDFRAPAGTTELATRRANGLTPRQDAHLVRWGYPYVLEDFRFHMTLSARLTPDQRALIEPAAQHWFAEAIAQPMAIDGLSLCHQPSREAPFIVRVRHRFRQP